MKRHVLYFVIACIFCSCSMPSYFSGPCSADPACLRVLFIGNSYTYVNDLPGILVKLAESGGDRLETGMAATGGWTLADHLKSAETLAQINASKWNYVVLQEQSNTPASTQLQETEMYPAARELAGKIKTAGARTILFITWGHQDGWPEAKISTYSDMQVAINKGYYRLGQQLPAILAPVGYAWLKVRQEHPDINLWQADGSHPSEAGTYLAACVFYTVLFRKSPVGLTYQGSLSNADAKTLQTIASDTVLNSAGSWNLP